MLLVVSLLVTAAAYWPGLAGVFMFDDHWNIVGNPALQLDSVSPQALKDAAESGRAGPLKRPVAMISFALNHAIWGPDAFSYKLTNLIIHLATGGLVFLFLNLLLSARKITHGSWLAAVVASLWLLHPLNLTAVLYVVQRMTSLSALFVLASLCCYLLGRHRLEAGRSCGLYFSAALALFMPLAVLSKETGVLVPLYIGLLEWLWFGLRFSDGAYPRWYARSLLLLIGLPAALGLAILLGYPELILGGYEYRPFTVLERLLTESRVLWSYLAWGLFPSLQSLGLFHDDIALSTGLLQPATTGWAVLGWTLLLGLLVMQRQRFPLVSFGLAFFLAGHLLESTILPLELVFEHRNYLPLVGLLLAAVGVLQALSQRIAKPQLAACVAVLLVIYCAALTLIRADVWSNLASFSMHQYHNHPESARSNYQIGRIYASSLESITDAQQRDEVYTRAIEHFVAATELRADFVDGLFGLLVLYSSNSIEVPQGLLDELFQRLEQTHLSASAVNQVNNLWTCQRAGDCQLNEFWLQDLLRMLGSKAGTSPALVEYLPPVE